MEGRGRAITAVLALVGLGVLTIAFHSRIAADFWPPDRSTVGPNLVAAVVQGAIVVVIAVLVWPPFRRRLHAFVDRKIGGVHDRFEHLHERLDELHARHDEHADAIKALHEKLDRKHPTRAIPGEEIGHTTSQGEW